MRRGEVLALRWKDIDFEDREYHVRRAWTDDTTLGPPKWGKIREHLALPEETVRKLKVLRSESLHILPDALVFHSDDGSRLTFRWWQNQFRAAMKKAKIKAKERHLTAHSFRHSLNTYLRAQGVHDEKIRAAMGWTQEKTQAGYTHWTAEHLRDQAITIDQLFQAGDNKKE